MRDYYQQIGALFLSFLQQKCPNSPLKRKALNGKYIRPTPYSYEVIKILPNNIPEIYQTNQAILAEANFSKEECEMFINGNICKDETTQMQLRQDLLEFFKNYKHFRDVRNSETLQIIQKLDELQELDDEELEIFFNQNDKTGQTTVVELPYQFNSSGQFLIALKDFLQKRQPNLQLDENDIIGLYNALKTTLAIVEVKPMLNCQQHTQRICTNNHRTTEHSIPLG